MIQIVQVWLAPLAMAPNQPVAVELTMELIAGQTRSVRAIALERVIEILLLRGWLIRFCSCRFKRSAHFRLYNILNFFSSRKLSVEIKKFFH